MRATIEQMPDPSPETPFDIANDENELITREFGDVLNEMKEHLTKEELLYISLYKNSKRQRNNIYKIFLEKYHKKSLTSSAITKRKKRMFHVLGHLGEMLRYKRTHNVDSKLKNILTKKQFVCLILYERRWTTSDIRKKLKLNSPAPIHCYYRAIGRLENSSDPTIKRYLNLLGNVLKFSRKYPVSKR